MILSRQMVSTIMMMKKFAELCHNVPLDVMRRMAKEIWVTLGIEKHDPRYINEEGILLMALS